SRGSSASTTSSTTGTRPSGPSRRMPVCRGPPWSASSRRPRRSTSWPAFSTDTSPAPEAQPRCALTKAGDSDETRYVGQFPARMHPTRSDFYALRNDRSSAGSRPTSFEEAIADESLTSDPDEARPGQPPWLSESRRWRRGGKLAPDHAECAPGSCPGQGDHAAPSYLKPLHSRPRPPVRQVVRRMGGQER